MFHNTIHRSLWSPRTWIEEGGQIRVSLTKSSIMHQKVHLPITLASLNNSHNFELRAYWVGAKSSSSPTWSVPSPCPLQCGLVVFAYCKFEQHRVKVWTCHWGGGPCSCRPLPHGGNDLGVQPYSALQQLCVEPLHQLLFNLALLGLEAHDAQVELALFLFRCIS